MIDPMLVADLKKPFESDQHIAELKLDGIRALLEVDVDRTRIYTRHQNDITSRFEEVTKACIRRSFRNNIGRRTCGLRY